MSQKENVSEPIPSDPTPCVVKASLRRTWLCFRIIFPLSLRTLGLSMAGVGPSICRNPPVKTSLRSPATLVASEVESFLATWTEKLEKANGNQEQPQVHWDGMWAS